jgi:hypothetical protein
MPSMERKEGVIAANPDILPGMYLGPFCLMMIVPAFIA